MKELKKMENNWLGKENPGWPPAGFTKIQFHNYHSYRGYYYVVKKEVLLEHLNKDGVGNEVRLGNGSELNTPLYLGTSVNVRTSYASVDPDIIEEYLEKTKSSKEEKDAE